MQVQARQKAEARPELTIERVFDAPREKVFECWTDGEHLKRWCCPKGMTIPHSEGDIRPGGAFKTCMKAADGSEHWLAGSYREIVPPEMLSFSHTWLDDAGKPQHETIVTIRLEDQGGRTKLTLHQAFFQSQASRDGHRGGWNETLDSLAAYLSR